MNVGMNYPEIPDSRFVAQPVNDLLFPWEEAGSAENLITIDKDERFSETMPQNTLRKQPHQYRPVVRSIENLQTLDSSLITKFYK